MNREMNQFAHNVLDGCKDPAHLYDDLKTPSLHRNNSESGAKEVTLILHMILTTNNVISCFRFSDSIYYPRFLILIILRFPQYPFYG